MRDEHHADGGAEHDCGDIDTTVGGHCGFLGYASGDAMAEASQLPREG